MGWVQVYDPVGHAWLSTLLAALPTGLLLATLGFLRWPAHRAAFTGLAAAVTVSVAIFGMPIEAALATTVFGAAYGLFPIGWIVLCAIFLYNLTVTSGTFDTVKGSVARLSSDRRIQALLIAFSFGAFIEGASGFGTPVAISAALLMGLGFAPRYAASLSLIANTAPVAFGAIGTPILTLAAVTGLPAFTLGAMAGRQLPFVSVLIPAWLIVTMSGWRGLRGVWPAVLVCGGSFAAVQLFWSNFVGPELVDIAGGLMSLACLGVFCLWWHPRDGTSQGESEGASARHMAPSRPDHARESGRTILHAWMPWVFLSLFVTLWGVVPIKALLNSGPSGLATYLRTRSAPAPSPILSPRVDVPGLHRLIFRDYPVEPTEVDHARIDEPAYRSVRAEAATFVFNWLSATGTSILLAAFATALFLRIPIGTIARVGRDTLRQMRTPLVTIAMMLALGQVTRYGGTDATLGLAFTQTGWLYPFFAALLGWLGVALTGSDTSANVLFGSLQKITAQQLGLDPILITAANSSGGVMGKMVAAQTIVVATAATGQQGHEGNAAALGLLAQPGAGGHRRPHRHGAGVPGAVDGAGTLTSKGPGARSATREASVPGLRSLIRGEDALSEPDRAGRDFDQFVVVDELDRLFEVQLARRHQADGLVGGRGAHVGLLLLFRHVDIEVPRARVLADDHALVDGGARVDEDLAALLQVVDRVGRRDPGAIGDQPAGQPGGNRPVPGLPAVEQVVHDAGSAGVREELRPEPDQPARRHRGTRAAPGRCRGSPSGSSCPSGSRAGR